MSNNHQQKLGKLQFKKPNKQTTPTKKMTNVLKNQLLQKRKQQDVEHYDKQEEHIVEKKTETQQDQDEQYEDPLKDKEEMLNPEAVIKKIKVGKTQAQIAYDMVKMKRIEDQISKVEQINNLLFQKKLQLTYREKIDHFNSKIARMPEHYDIPKVGPG